MNIKILTIFLISFWLGGCSLFGTKIDVDATVTAIPRAPLVLPPVDEVKLDSIKWRLVTEKNIEEQIQKLVDQGFDPVLFSITDEDYETMSLNQAKTLKLLLQQRAVIHALKEYYMNQEPKEGIEDDGTDDATE